MTTATMRSFPSSISVSSPLTVRLISETRIGDAMAACSPDGQIERRIGNARPQAGVRAAAIVMSDPLPEDVPQMPLIQRNHEIQALSAHRAQQPFAECVRLGRANGRLQDRQTHGRDRPIDASDKTCSRPERAA